MRLRASGRTYGRCIHGGVGALVAILAAGPIGPDVASGIVGGTRGGTGLGSVSVRWNLADGQGDGFDARTLAQNEPRALMDGDPAAQVGQGEGGLTVTAIGGADEIE